VRKFSWTVPVIVAVCLISYFLVWPGFGDREDTHASDALIADMKTAGDEIDKVIAEVPEQPNKADLQRSIQRFAELNKKTQELVPRMRETVPELKGDAMKR
jgi:hypothetical protein